MARLSFRPAVPRPTPVAADPSHAPPESYVLVRRIPGAVLVSADARTPPIAMDAVLSALAGCAPPQPVVLDLREVLLTEPMVAALHRALCGPAAFEQRVGLVATRASSRRRLQSIARCRGLPLHASVAEALWPGPGTERRSQPS